jgi:hypothetical protein
MLAACGSEGRSDRRKRNLNVQQKGDTIEVRGPDGTVLIKGNQESASINIKTDDGSELKMGYNSGTLAPDFPKDMPIPPNCTIEMNQVFQNGNSAIATLTTAEPSEKIIQFYETQIPIKGWEPGSRYDLDNITMLNGTRGSAKLNVSITAANDKTTINMARTEDAG